MLTNKLQFRIDEKMTKAVIDVMMMGCRNLEVVLFGREGNGV